MTRKLASACRGGSQFPRHDPLPKTRPQRSLFTLPAGIQDRLEGSALQIGFRRRGADRISAEKDVFRIERIEWHLPLPDHRSVHPHLQIPAAAASGQTGHPKFDGVILLKSEWTLA